MAELTSVSRLRPLLAALPVATAALAVAVLISRPTDVAPSYWSTIVDLVNGRTSWLSPRLPVNGALIDKPPLYFWLAALSVKAFGFHMWAVRLPDAVAAVVTLALIVRIVTPLGTAAQARAGWGLALTPAWLIGAASTPITPELMLWLTLSFYALQRWSQRRELLWMLAAATSWGLAFATKEWAAVLPLPAFVVSVRPWSWDRSAARQAGVAAGLALALAAAWPLWTVFGVQAPAPYGGSATSALLQYNLLGRLDPATIQAFQPGSVFAPPVTSHPILSRGLLWWASDHAALLWWPLLAGAVAGALGRYGAGSIAAWLWLAGVLLAYALVALPMPQYLDEALVPLALALGQRLAGETSGGDVARASPARAPRRVLRVLRVLRRALPGASWSMALCWSTPLGGVAALGAAAALLTAGRRRSATQALLASGCAVALAVDVALLAGWHSATPWRQIDDMVRASAPGAIIVGDMWTASSIAIETGRQPLTLLDNYAARRSNIDVDSALCPAGGIAVVSQQLRMADPASVDRLARHQVSATQAGVLEVWQERC